MSYTDVLIAIGGYCLTGVISFISGLIIGYMAERRKRSNVHSDKIKSSVLSNWLTELEGKCHSLEDCITSNGGADLKILDVKFYFEDHYFYKDVAGKHFPDMVKDWDEFKNVLPQYWKRCFDFAFDMKDAVEKSLQAKNVGLYIASYNIQLPQVNYSFIEQIYQKLRVETKGKKYHPTPEVKQIGIPKTPAELIVGSTEIARGTEAQMNTCCSIFDAISTNSTNKTRMRGLLDESEGLEKRVKKFEEELKKVIETEKTIPGKCDYY